MQGDFGELLELPSCIKVLLIRRLGRATLSQRAGQAQEARASWLDARAWLQRLALQPQKMQVQPTAMVSMTI